MNMKAILGSIIIVVFLIFGSYSFFETNLEYTDVSGAMRLNKKVQLKGVWNKEKEAFFDPTTTQFTFFLIDDNGGECKVILDGAAPNNFELATSVVAKGNYMETEGYFHATEVLTKCPSKYEADAEEVNKSV
ncbi:MAG: cytochrome c maturation protein CcmE [Ignavibacteria bacterium]|nr:cytochrome c maturation protein CcmE [Ignavibacteria bacterium]